MKSKLRFFLFFFFIIINCNNSFSEAFLFKTKNLKILKEENRIISDEGTAESKDENLLIKSNEFEYLINSKILFSNGNGKAKIIDDNIEIDYNQATFDQINLKIIAEGNVKIKLLNSGFTIITNKIIYDRSNKTINSPYKTNIYDEENNFFSTYDFYYEIDKNLIKANKIEFKDKNNDILKSDIVFINTKTKNIFGKDIEINLNSFKYNKNNDTRLKGNSIIDNEDLSIVSKGVFTICKKNDNCPPWKILAKKIIHKKKEKIIEYESASLRLYDIPVFYFPKFYHPDPTVKRKSGFLAPYFSQNANGGSAIISPYFLTLAENKDATFSPRVYSENEVLFQTEYRQANKNSNHLIDFSQFIGKNKNSQNHFFYSYDKELNLKNFKYSEINLLLQSTGNDTYIKKNNITSQFTNTNNILENSFNLDLLSKNENYLSLNTTLYENLNKPNNDRYELIAPEINFESSLNNNLNLDGNFSFRSRSFIRNYETNIYETININDLFFRSNRRTAMNGIENNYEFLIKNSNTNANNSNEYKNKEDSFVSGIFQFNSTLPLIKVDSNYQKIITPKLSLKIAPNHNRDSSSNDQKIDLLNVYSIDRAAKSNLTENGISITYGSKYSLISNESYQNLLEIELANNLRFKDTNNLPRANQINQKTSNLFGQIKFNPNEIFDVKYNFAIKNNIREINSENLLTSFKINNFVSSFEYLNENNDNTSNSFLSNKTEYFLNDSNSFGFNIRKNKTTNLTEFYDLIYQYRNDCLIASIEYNKNFYEDRDIKPGENMFFKLTILPFGETSSQNLLK